MARKMNGKGKNRFPKSRAAKPKVILLTRSDLERARENGAFVDREKNPTMVIIPGAEKSPDGFWAEWIKQGENCRRNSTGNSAPRVIFCFY